MASWKAEWGQKTMEMRERFISAEGGEKDKSLAGNETGKVITPRFQPRSARLQSPGSAIAMNTFLLTGYCGFFPFLIFWQSRAFIFPFSSSVHI